MLRQNDLRKVLRCTIGNHRLCVPMTTVRGIQTASREDWVTLHDGSPGIIWNHQTIPILQLSQFLHQSEITGDSNSRNHVLLIQDSVGLLGVEVHSVSQPQDLFRTEIQPIPELLRDRECNLLAGVFLTSQWNERDKSGSCGKENPVWVLNPLHFRGCLVKKYQNRTGKKDQVFPENSKQREQPGGINLSFSQQPEEQAKSSFLTPHEYLLQHEGWRRVSFRSTALPSSSQLLCFDLLSSSNAQGQMNASLQSGANMPRRIQLAFTPRQIVQIIDPLPIHQIPLQSSPSQKKEQLRDYLLWCNLIIPFVRWEELWDLKPKSWSRQMIVRGNQAGELLAFPVDAMTDRLKTPVSNSRVDSPFQVGNQFLDGCFTLKDRMLLFPSFHALRF